MVLKNGKADCVSPAGVCPAEVIVLKFGSSVLRTAHDLPNAVHEIYRWVRDGYRVIAVVSAIGNTTEVLIRDSQMLCAAPEAFATAELLATGERASAALLGIALDRAGVPAHVVSPREIGFQVTGTPFDAEPTGLDVARVGELLHAAPVLVVPGFFGTDPAGRTHCLGRGGSDLTAVFLAVSLYARCRLIKDKWCVDRNVEQPPQSPKFLGQRAVELHITDAPYSASSQSRSERLGRHLDDAMELPPLAALASACLFISRSTFA